MAAPIKFVERLTIAPLNDSESSLLYESLLGLQKEEGLLSVLRSLFPSRGREQAVRFGGEYEQRLGLFQSALSKRLRECKLRSSEQQRLSHPQFKRQDRLPAGEYSKFARMKGEVYAYFCELNGPRRPNPYSLDNLICRFLKFKEYRYEESLRGVKHYLEWERGMRARYSEAGFEKYSKLGLYEWVGRDREGRVVLLFRPYLFFYEQIEDPEEYVDYTLYMLDLFIEDHSEGYIDDFILLADYHPFTADNFKLSVARAVAEQSKELFPDRQFKLICYGLGSFSYLVFRMLKPFLPSFVLEKAAFLGTDRGELLRFLEEFMEVSQLPEEVREGRK